MSNPFTLAGYGFAALVLAPWALWALYVLVMGVYRAKLSGRLGPAATILAAPWVLLGFALDVLVNLTAASLLFAEPPREWKVTQRLQRHQLAGDGWRADLARWICDHLLDVFDPTGNHC